MSGLDFMGVQILGTCSLCRGRVVVPTIWWGVVPPEPKCEGCGAHPKGHGPVIEMESARYRYQTSTITSAGTGAWHFEKERD